MYQLSPKQLDEQSSVKIERWLDMNSKECLDMDSDPNFTKKCYRIGTESGMLDVDNRGRIWGKGKDGGYFPFHFEYGKLLYGYRVARLAAN